jgi:uncharacterized protein (UPF0248 family)
MNPFFYPENNTRTPNKKYKRQNKLVHHIVNHNLFVQNEIDNSEKIKQKDYDYERRFYLLNTSETLKIAEVDEITQFEISNDKNVLLTFENEKLIYLDLYLKSLSSSRKYIFQIIEFYRYLLQTISWLDSINMVYNNISLNTIIIDPLENPLLTNFMFSIDLNATGVSEYMKHIVCKDKNNYPLEFCILKYQVTNKLDSLSIYNIENVIKQFIDDHDILNTFGKKLVDEYKESASKYFSRYNNKSYEQNVLDILQFSSTWDNYALSFVYLQILIGLHRVIKVNNKFIINFMKLLVNNIHPDPSKRPSIKQISERFEQMIYDVEMNEFTDLIKLL